MITQELVRELIDYNPETGSFKWRVRDSSHFKNERKANSWNARYAGKPCGCVSSIGYLAISLLNKQAFGHRLAFMYIHGYIPKEIDHINGDRLDNRICNIRDASRTENSWNKGIRNDSSTGFKCVSAIYRNGSVWKYSARIQHNGKRRYIGLFDSASEASDAYIAEEALLRSEWVRKQTPN